MREKLQYYKEKSSEFWKGRSLPQKILMVGAVISLIALIVGASLFASNPKLVPLYNDLSVQEVGQIKEELDARGVKYELGNQGTTVMVPETSVDGLLVDLAAQGLPDSGSIDYGFFSDNTSWGMTDNEFGVMKIDAMQTELSNLMKQIEGIENAKVMINMPEEKIFVGEEKQTASASIVVNVNKGYQLKEDQIQSLYHLVSKAIPNLPTDNIAIMDQNFKYFDPKKSSSIASGQSYEYQQSVKDDIQNDIQRRVQQMLGMMMGQDKVMVSVTADVDFTQENRTENLVQPAEDGEEGLPVSVERITETYTGDPGDVNAGGTVNNGNDVPTYQGDGEEGTNGDYEMMKETINNEFNRIQRNIVESPYKIRDLGIQVAVDQNKDSAENGAIQQLSAAEQATLSESITSILSSIVSTSIDQEFGPVEPENKVSIVFQEFNGKPEFNSEPSPTIPVWVYIAGGILLVVVASLIWVLSRRRKQQDLEAENYVERERTPVEVPAMEEPEETESSVRRKQLERMAKEKPEDFAKLLRSWIAED
ncbi:flagellar basal-body MS-ring/collar protein FliF [Pontibacillus sp. HN14]|uniref:Flagellar M-ring protein n=2 Tax=Pontibacillus chungwhensis TaxID=265426 RepID=A0ABY8V2J6_9BACI|nr:MULTISPECIES: flagellar basal-body MS-ring/collar protein FliF [Pontibacillus]MCD5322680.1 flagellar M-ring protein FliF [Pontibacillus sp. HN14]WIG00177.1 flagellar basal-body MS-ring/collar protein FliF [Pontibacillus chungwhensis]